MSTRVGTQKCTSPLTEDTQLMGCVSARSITSSLSMDRAELILHELRQGW